MSAARTTWRATEPEAAARRVAGRPAQAFWPLLAPSFRWVLLPPHRRAGVDAIDWEWRASTSPAKPGAADLNDLRARLRDSLDLLAADLRRRPALPDGLAAAALLDEFEQVFGALRHASDPVLAEYAVLTDLGWMLRSWGVSRPSPARADAPAPSAAAPATEAKATEIPAREAASSRRKQRLLLWSLPAVALIAAFGWQYRAHETRSPDDVTTQADAARAPEPKEPGPAVDIALAAPPSADRDAAAPKPPPAPTSAGTRPADATPAAAVVTPLQTGSVSPAALTGEMAAAPDALAPRAGPPSKVKGDEETPPGFAARRPDAAPGSAPAASPANADAGRPPESGADAPSGNEAPPPASAANAARPPEKTDRANTPEAPPRLPPDPGDSAVEARGAPPPTPPPATLPGRDAETRDANPRATREEETLRTARAPDDGERSPANADTSMPPRSGESAEPASDANEADAAPVWDAPARRLRLRAAPWRLVLERDIVLPSRPFEGTGEAEIRAARIAAWAQARALTPPAFRRKELLAGWTFNFDPVANGKKNLAWRIKRGTPVVQELDSAGGRARLGWPDSDSGEMDAWLTDASGAPVARVWRRPDENRLRVFVAPTVGEVRPWFALKLRPADSGEGLDAPEGWNLENGKRQLLAEGPEGSTRMRWTHTESGWVLHGGYTHESP